MLLMRTISHLAPTNRTRRAAAMCSHVSSCPEWTIKGDGFVEGDMSTAGEATFGQVRDFSYVLASY